MDFGDYYFWQTAVRAALCVWLAYLFIRPDAALFVQVLGGFFGFLALTRMIFLYRAGVGLQPTDPLMLAATSLEAAALLVVGGLLWTRRI